MFPILDFSGDANNHSYHFSRIRFSICPAGDKPQPYNHRMPPSSVGLPCMGCQPGVKSRLNPAPQAVVSSRQSVSYALRQD